MTYPFERPRRVRQNAAIRAMTSRVSLGRSHLIAPLFLQSQGESTPIPSMEGQFRLNLTGLLREAETLLGLGIRACALFSATEPSLKDEKGSEALNEKGLIPQAIRALKARFPELLVIADVALDPYTSHGQDGLLGADGAVLGDETVAILVAQSRVLVGAGADILAPSDMMDGRIGAIRAMLEAEKHPNTLILAYTAKYASAFYGPFRDAVGSSSALKGDKKGYQMPPQSDRGVALWEAKLDIEEGADILMVKPAGPYLDILSALSTLGHPLFAYQVSGEYAALQFAAKAGALDLLPSAMESLLSIRRAGADSILTYFAKTIAPHLPLDT